MLSIAEIEEIYKKLGLDPSKITEIPSPYPSWLESGEDDKIYLFPVSDNSSTPRLTGAGKNARIERNTQ